MLSDGKKSNTNQHFVSQGTYVLYQPGLRKPLHLRPPIIFIFFSGVAICGLCYSMIF